MNTAATTATATYADQEATLIYIDPNKLLLPTEWENPRSEISDADYSELLASVKVKGVHTPVAGRYVEAGIEIVAGFTRRRTAIEALLPQIPCLVRHMTVQEAIELSASENIDRTAMGAMDEARALKNIIKNHNGDLKAASSEMGWSQVKFNRAIQLLRASDHVQSLIGKKQSNGFVLSVGHAARLSVLPEDVQNAIVVAVIRDKMTVNILNDKIKKAVKRPLNSATFCQSDCVSCPFNTDVQTTLFMDDTKSADCTNPSCFEEKTQKHFEEQIVELEKEYGKVVLLSTVDNPVVVSKNSVGEEQYNNGCLSCAKHCAILSDKGLNQGAIIKDQCLDSVCAQKHAADVEKAKRPKSTETAVIAQNAAKKDSIATKAAPTKTKSATTNTVEVAPKRLVLESQTSLSEVAKPLLLSTQTYHLAVCLAALKAQEKAGEDVEKNIIKFMAMSPQQLETETLQTIENITQNGGRESLNMERTLINAANKHVESFTVEATKAWTPTVERLTDMTKTIRQKVLAQSGFEKAYIEAHSEKEYAALLNSKTEVQVALIMGFTFDWSNFAPDYYTTAITTQKYNY
ncbi:ParB/RepB/Spo0J family partition protein [Vibrio sp. 1180_3]|uniref:ParB/RepB/Spo0J family partition protein n=1 Tax=Vibrio sp. 1180_3 TaxID=2528832 RepID=UPI002407710D|nr:ParB/RepB/Spo0J family partition protein [Vibrio sp. 1180_3]MDF9399075.1 ParB/RepB/Spo0J family partition protein [Vibrio sp. 1180_3]